MENELPTTSIYLIIIYFKGESDYLFISFINIKLKFHILCGTFVWYLSVHGKAEVGFVVVISSVASIHVLSIFGAVVVGGILSINCKISHAILHMDLHDLEQHFKIIFCFSFSDPQPKLVDEILNTNNKLETRSQQICVYIYIYISNTFHIICLYHITFCICMRALCMYIRVMVFLPDKCLY